MSKQDYLFREAKEEDIDFIAKLTRRNLQHFFERTGEGWSESKLLDVQLSRIRILEKDTMRAGFIDIESSQRFGGGIYVHNIQIHDNYKKHGLGILALRFIEDEARERNLLSIYGKIFGSSRALKWALFHGYRIVEEIPEENSFWVKKEVEI